MLYGFSVFNEKVSRCYYVFLVYQVGGVHFSLLSKVRYDIGDSCSLDSLIDSIFPLFRKHIEPDLHHAQVHVLLPIPLNLGKVDWGQEAFPLTCDL